MTGTGDAVAVEVGDELVITATVKPSFDSLHYAIKWTTDKETKAKFDVTYTETLSNALEGLEVEAVVTVTAEIVEVYFEGGVRKYKSLTTPIQKTLAIEVEAAQEG